MKSLCFIETAWEQATRTHVHIHVYTHTYAHTHTHTHSLSLSLSLALSLCIQFDFRNIQTPPRKERPTWSAIEREMQRNNSTTGASVAGLQEQQQQRGDGEQRVSGQRTQVRVQTLPKPRSLPPLTSRPPQQSSSSSTDKGCDQRGDGSSSVDGSEA